MNYFQLIRGAVQQAMSQISGQRTIASGLLDTLKGYEPMVQAAWIGGDADEYVADFRRKIVPAMIELIAAIGGINLNLSKAVSAVDQMEQKCKSIVSGLTDEFKAI